MRDDSVDLVTCVTALHLFADPPRALREAARVCRPTGRVVFTTWAADGWSSSRVLRDVARDHGIDLPDRYAASGTPGAAGDLARSSGLEAADVLTLEHAESRTEAAHSIWIKVTAGLAPFPGEVETAFTAALGDQVEHRLLLVTCRPA